LNFYNFDDIFKLNKLNYLEDFNMRHLIASLALLTLAACGGGGGNRPQEPKV